MNEVNDLAESPTGRNFLPSMHHNDEISNQVQQESDLDFRNMRFGAIVDLRNRESLRDLEIFTALSDQRLESANELEVIFVVDNFEGACIAAEEWTSSPLIRSRYVIGDGTETIIQIALRESDAAWYHFPNADDRLAPGYFKNLSKYFTEPISARSPLVSTKMMVHKESGGWKQSWQRFKFIKSTSLNLDKTSYVTQVHAASTIFSSTAIRTLDESIIQDPEMTLHRLIGLLLVRQEVPMLGIAPRAVYRAFGESPFAENEVATRSRLAHAEHFEKTYLRLFEAIPDDSSFPEWLGTMFLYDLALLLKREPRLKTRLAGLSSEEHRRLLNILEQCLVRIPDNWILSLRFPTMSVEARNMLLALKADGSVSRTYPAGKVRIARMDVEQEVALIRYFFSGPLPAEKFSVGGVQTDPVGSKIRSVGLLRQHKYFERLVWIPAHSWLQVELNGVRQEMVLRAFTNADYQMTLSSIRNEFAPEPRKPPIPAPPTSAEEFSSTTNSSIADDSTSGKDSGTGPSNRSGAPRNRRPGALSRMWRSLWNRTSSPQDTSKQTQQKQPVKPAPRPKKPSPKAPSVRKATQKYAYADTQIRKFADAWIFMDRVNMAQDSAEHLYRYVMHNHPEINSWYVLDSSSVDWERLKEAGFKLLEFGSIDHAAAYMNAAHVISSHLSPEVVSPIPIDFYQSRVRPWKTTFLQHGVTKDDMSHWLNQRTIDTLVTATEAEYKSFVGDGTPYVVTNKEVVLTGFPRHDALKAKRRSALEEGSISTILVAPTWRDSLLKPKSALGTQRELVDNFSQTTYATEWSGVLSDKRLIRAAADHGCRVVLLPHPNMQNAVDELSMDPSVEVIRYEDGDIQELLARTKILITDYSSLAFETAIIDAPVVYLQTDRRLVFSGRHTYSPGYYDYAEDGFGPIIDTVAEVGSAVEGLLDDMYAVDGLVPEPYLTRINRTFTMRDESSCKLVFEAIRKTEQPRRSIRGRVVNRTPIHNG